MDAGATAAMERVGGPSGTSFRTNLKLAGNRIFPRLFACWYIHATLRRGPKITNDVAELLNYLDVHDLVPFGSSFNSTIATGVRRQPLSVFRAYTEEKTPFPLIDCPCSKEAHPVIAQVSEGGINMADCGVNRTSLMFFISRTNSSFDTLRSLSSRS
jgi:hypothetical protein